jgi:hypothetical protein
MWKVKFSILFASLFAFIGIAIGLYLTGDAVSENYHFFYIFSGTAAFLTAWTLSYFLIERKANYSNLRIALVALIVGVMSHWVCWYLITIELNIRYYFLDEFFFEPPLNLLEATYWVFAPCLYSWMFFGWATIIGAGISAFLARKWTTVNS